MNYYILGAGVTLALSFLGLIGWMIREHGKLLVSEETVKDDQIEAQVHTLSDSELDHVLGEELGLSGTTERPKQG